MYFNLCFNLQHAHISIHCTWIITAYSKSDCECINWISQIIEFTILRFCMSECFRKWVCVCEFVCFSQSPFVFLIDSRIFVCQMKSDLDCWTEYELVTECSTFVWKSSQLIEIQSSSCCRHMCDFIENALAGMLKWTTHYSARKIPHMKQSHEDFNWTHIVSLIRKLPILFIRAGESMPANGNVYNTHTHTKLFCLSNKATNCCAVYICIYI